MPSTEVFLRTFRKNAAVTVTSRITSGPSPNLDLQWKTSPPARTLTTRGRSPSPSAVLSLTSSQHRKNPPLPHTRLADELQWISWFLSSKGNEYFCEVDEDFILDRFNLTGLNNEVANYAQALDLITDQLDDEVQEELRGSLDTQARLLYGLIHARWIVTARGLAKMVEKYKRGDFGRCPRVLCHAQPLLPVGIVDIPYEKSVKLFCGRCEDLYSPKSSRHGSIDGAYFGTTFPHLLFLVYPAIIPPKVGVPLDSTGEARGGTGAGSTGAAATAASARRRTREREKEELLPEVTGTDSVGEGISTASVALKAERYRPKIYGFQVHETAKLQRWQEAIRDRQVAKLEVLEARGSA
ncbi:Casein kinase II subunit beta [Mycena indigotica]|uniref:Casein kinase II subunit beta n=1 Tax=Mycena indigotica TaxID=2126181 RepID=A0A8H6T6M2_9AGAR|nr:Casein kinase II subunit beta [Mycena indigotica]KAF7311865.1 Casein kinase II subunit beta [Mycena indigotica]